MESLSISLYLGYKDLQTRKETREAAWSRPGWDECVAYTGIIEFKKYLILLVTQNIYITFSSTLEDNRTQN